MRDASTTKSLVAAAAIVVVAGGIRLASSIAVPIILALFIAFVSAPLVFRMTRRGVPNGLAVSLVLLGQLVSLLVIGGILQVSVVELQEQLPVYSERLGLLSDQAQAILASYGISDREVEGEEGVQLSSALEFFSSALSSLGSLFSSGSVVILIAAFTLFDAGRLWRRIDAHFARSRGDSLLNEISHEVNRYLGIKTLTSLLTGLLAGVACAVVGVDFPILWGLVAFLLNYIPVIGSVIAAVPPVIIALLMLGLWPAAAVAMAYVAINVVIGNVLEPRLMDRALGISAAAVMISVVVGEYLLGPVGALLSVPLVMILKMAFSSRTQTRWMADLIGGEEKDAAVAPAEPTGRLSMPTELVVEPQKAEGPPPAE